MYCSEIFVNAPKSVKSSGKEVKLKVKDYQAELHFFYSYVILNELEK